ncbi:MAG TPA: hypothetical protein VFP12_15140 [Allosphingosinicella sp.]|nr:hypothetical protein [Allosphingosinicella sp.]
MKLILAATSLLLGLAACSPEPASKTGPAATAANETAPPAAATPSSAPPPADPAAPAANVLTLEGLGALRIGEKVPAGSGWAERGAQISETCRTASSPDHPGVYAIVEEGEVARITVGQGSDVKLVEGIGVGAAEAAVRAAFAGFRAEPHKYSEAPAKYLTAPNADSGDPALRFEIGADGKVALIHIGTRPVLFYVEGCA